MRKWLNNYLALSKGEFNGLIVLVCCILAVSIFPSIYRWFSPPKFDQANPAETLQQLEQTGAIINSSDTTAQGSAAHNENRKVKKAMQLFPFDPNTLQPEGWQQLGFSEKQSQSIRRYIEKGGRFREVADLKRLYVVSPEAYEKLAPYVRIKALAATYREPFTRIHKTPVPWQRTEKTAVVVDLNRADSTTLLQVRGIGPAFASRILKYRDRVGGFHRKEQLLEVFGLDSVKFQEIKEQVLVDGSIVKRLNINTAGFEQFKNHPYLRYKQINAIIQYRAQHGNYGNFEDLKKVAILSPDVLDKLAPYISF